MPATHARGDLGGYDGRARSLGVPGFGVRGLGFRGRVGRVKGFRVEGFGVWFWDLQDPLCLLGLWRICGLRSERVLRHTRPRSKSPVALNLPLVSREWKNGSNSS